MAPIIPAATGRYEYQGKLMTSCIWILYSIGRARPQIVAAGGWKIHSECTGEGLELIEEGPGHALMA